MTPNSSHKKDKGKRLNNPDFLRDMIQNFCQEYLEQEMVNYLQALPYERSQSRKGHRNGYKPRKLKTRVGELKLSIPQSRDCGFSTELFERYQRSEKAFISCLQEMVIHGVATRRVRKITEKLCGVTFSKSQVSEITKKLDKQVKAWLSRPLTEKYPYLIVDARYEKIRRDHKVESNAVMIAKGINKKGYREILSVSDSNSENTTNWYEFFSDLKERGLRGVDLVTSDAHEGLRTAIRKCFTGTEWQRCQAHFTKNVMDRVRNKDKANIKSRLHDIYNAPDKETAIARLRQLVIDLEDKYPQLAEFLVLFRMRHLI